MIERRIISFAGPAGGGKTNLLERLLEARHTDVLHCVRAVKLARRDTNAGAEDDLSRYRQAGAAGAWAYTYSAAAHPEDFFESDPFLDVQDAILVEGPMPPGILGELEVFVFRPQRLPALLRHVPKITPRQIEREMKLYQAALQRDAALERFAVAKIGEFGRLLTATAAGRAKLRAAMQHEGPPQVHPVDDKWALSPGYEALVTAGLVVINVGSPAERKRAEALRGEIERLRSDEQVFRDVAGTAGNRVPKTIVIADLRDSADPETKKAVRRLAKVWARRTL